MREISKIIDEIENLVVMHVDNDKGRQRILELLEDLYDEADYCISREKRP